MNTLQVQRLDAFNGLVVGFARHPAESFVIAAVGEHHIVIFAGNTRNQGNRGGKIFYFGRHGESRIDQHRHRQFVAGAVIDDAALGGERNLALLLVLGLLHKAAVAKNLQINQPAADGHAPQQEHRAQQIEPGILAELGVGHVRHSQASSAGVGNQQFVCSRQTWRTTVQADRQIRSCGDGVVDPSAERSSAVSACATTAPPAPSRLHTRHHRRVRIGGSAIHADHLPRFGRHQPHAARHYVDSLRIAQ
jgi:hypothetical protein